MQSFPIKAKTIWSRSWRYYPEVNLDHKQYENSKEQRGKQIFSDRKYNLIVRLEHIYGFAIILFFAFWSSCTSGEMQEDPNEWPNYNHDIANTHFSELSQINKENVINLKVAWTREDQMENGSSLFFNPLMVHHRLITLMPSNELVALNPSDGKIIWKFMPDSSPIVNWDRSVAYYKDEDDQKDLIYFIFGSTMYCIHAHDGSLNTSFSKRGKLDFYEGIEVEPALRDKAWVTSNAPGIIYKNLIIVGCKVPDELPSPPGDIRAFDRNTGALKWTFHTIPKPGEYGAETWAANARTRNGGANCWGGMALDDKRGIVYIPTASPAFDFYGADRPGQNLFANCLLALDANTGKRIWHFQTTHHDLWDRDNGSPPNLITVHKDGKDIDAVGLVTKMAYLFLFDRETGLPLYPINEVPVDTVSTMPGERPWPTQPIPSRPSPFSRQGFRPEYYSTATPTSAQYIKDEIEKHGYKTGIYEPPGLKGSLLLPAAHGGANWGGASYNPHSGVLYVNAIDMPWYLALIENNKLEDNNKMSGPALYKIYCNACHGPDMRGNGIAPDISQKVKEYTSQKLENILIRGVAPMPSFRQLPQTQINTIIGYLQGKINPEDIHTAQTNSSNYEPYSFAGYNFYKDSSDLFAIKPPFGTMSAIDVNKAEIDWQVPLGTNDQVEKLGIKNSGDFNRGGGIATAGGLLFIAATTDNKLRAMDQADGKVLWEAPLPGMASSIPTTYAENGKQFIVVSVSPRPSTHYNGGYVTFTLK